MDKQERPDSAENGHLSFAAVPNLVATVWGIALLLSISRQIGFYSFSDPKLMAFMSLQDIVANSLLYLPASVIGIVSNYIVRAYQITANPSPRMVGFLRWYFRPSGRIAIGIGVSSLVILSLFTTNWPIYAMIFSLVFLPDVLAWVRGSQFADKIKHFSVFILAMFYAGLLFLSGVAEAISLSKKAPDYLVATDHIGEVDMLLLRQTQKFILFRLSDGTLINIPVDEVRSMKQLVPANHQASLSIPPELWELPIDWFQNAMSAQTQTKQEVENIPR